MKEKEKGCGKAKAKAKVKANQKAKAKAKSDDSWVNVLASYPTKTELIIFSEWSIGHSEKINKFSFFCDTPICQTKIIAL